MFTKSLPGVRANAMDQDTIRRVRDLTADNIRGKRQTARRMEQLERIARDELGVTTLLPRNSDSLDFYDLHVANLREALDRAFEAGIASVNKE